MPMSPPPEACVARQQCQDGAKTGSKSSRTALVYNIVLAVTGPIFVAGLIIGLSIGLDAALFDDSLIQRLQASK
ncbi:MAG: hypothetical protein WBD83_08325, partial [Xanthobacteraceae bacterium]